MLRYAVALSHTHKTVWTRPFVTRAGAGNVTDEDISEARQWLAKFDTETIPRHIFDISFSRSSGPGGQNVNKTNTKATLKVPLSTLQAHIPSLLWSTILQSPFCKTESLVIQADDSRKQQENARNCQAKLHNLIVQAGKDAVPGETSQAQTQRVKNLQRSENEGRLRMKKKQSAKKSARKSGGSSDY